MQTKTIMNVCFKKGKSTPKTILISLKVDKEISPLFSINFIPVENDIEIDVSIFDSRCEQLENGNIRFEYNGVRKDYDTFKYWFECVRNAPQIKLLQAIFGGIEKDFVEF